ncbi:MAG: hypothetical protein JNM94_18495 [Phycisphaerae bacterium]|nr:hypothetical protein [Phycisphaerae bacterium]
MNRAFVRLASVLAPLAISAAALAQGAGPRPPKLDTAANPIIGYAIMAVLSFIVLAISLYPSKRAHTDL